jgi:phosphopantothenoylcysteine decarboxylase/phosphopantothenate--cysteine ligase
MLDKKELDGVCLNILSQDNPFGSDNNNIELFLKNQDKTLSFEGDKLTLSLNLLNQLQEVFNEQ